MARRPDTPCAGCGKLLWSSTSSLPAGQRKCNACRRAESKAERVYHRSGCVDCGKPSAGVRCRACAADFVRQGAPASERRHEQARRRQWRDRAAPGLNHWRKRRPLLDKWRSQGRGCAYCDGAAETIDHVIPLARGGTNYEGNLVPCCLSCNADKRERVITEWRLAKQAKADRTPVEPPPPRPPKVKPIRGEELVLKQCAKCDALHYRTGQYCGSDCSSEANRERARNRYRVRVGIPVDAPLYVSIRKAS